MIREEEIKDFAVKRFGCECNESQFMLSKIQACIVGAKWADKTMIDKACEWLLHQEEMIGISFESDFIERFKKAMEE